jgi:hypothetical protein
VAIIALATASVPLAARAQASRESDLKAALLFNLSQFVEYPASAFPEADSPIVIAVLGRDPFGRTLDDLVRPVTVKGRRIVIERYATVEALRSAHVLFIASNRESAWPDILDKTRSRPILTVADFPNFARRGGMIEFFRSDEDKLRLRINLPAARDSGLTLSAKLLRVAEVIEPGGAR